MDFDQNNQHIRVPSFVPAADVGGATPQPETTDFDQSMPAAIAPPSNAGTASPHAQTASSGFLPDLSPYDLTVGEALDVFPRERRKRPADRTLQRYCQDGRFDCYKLKTTRNGNPVHEWIINSTSLLEFVLTKPVEVFAAPVVAPINDGVANESANSENAETYIADVATTPDQVGDADSDLASPRTADVEPAATATPTENDDAITGFASRVELMVENAKLTARLDSQEDLIGELREDKKFMREQITHQRGNDTLMADMHRETLHTLKAVSVAGRHTRIEMPGAASAGEQGNASYDAQENEQRPSEDTFGGV